MYCFLTVHLFIILVGGQLDAQFLLYSLYLNPLVHVSSNSVLILRKAVILIQLWGHHITAHPLLSPPLITATHSQSNSSRCSVLTETALTAIHQAGPTQQATLTESAD
jgi:hypothetical protein